MIYVRKILYATDFSPYSNLAYFHAVALAEQHGADLAIAYVHTPGATALETVTADADRDYWRGQLEQLRPVNPRIGVHHVFLSGDPAEELLRYAAAESVDLIVLGTHGRTGLERLLMGSVAEKVFRGAACSVMVVKMPKGSPTGGRASPGP